MVGNENTDMKAISTKPKLNSAFKAVQPLPMLIDTLPADLHYAAAPRLDVACQTTEPTRNAVRAAENGACERGRRSSAVAGLAGVVQSCSMMAELPPHSHGSRALEVRLIG